MGFEPTRAEPIGLAVQRLNHSATASLRIRNWKEKEYPFWLHSLIDKEAKWFPTPGVEPGPPGWKPDILAVRPRGILFPSGIEPETFCVLGRCDNRYTTETVVTMC